MSPLNITQPLGIWSIMATIRRCPIFPKWDSYQPLKDYYHLGEHGFCGVRSPESTTLSFQIHGFPGFLGVRKCQNWSVGASVENCFCISRISSPNWHQRFRIWQSRASWSCIQMPLAMLEASSRGHPDLSTVDVRHRHIIFPCLQEGQNLLPAVVIMDFSILSLMVTASSQIL